MCIIYLYLFIGSKRLAVQLSDVREAFQEISNKQTNAMKV